MSSQPNLTIGLIVADASLGDILSSVFADEGMTVYTWEPGPATLQDILRARPNVLLLGIGPRDRTVALLDDLRVDPELNAIPLIVFGTLERLEEEAQASGNVRSVLSSPFDLGDLLRAVDAALTGVPFEARIQTQPLKSELFQAAVDVLLRSERRIVFAWITRARAAEPLARYENLSPREFIDNMPRVLNALALALRHEAPPDVLESDPDLRERLRIHADLRRRQKIPAEIVVHEYQLLRRVIADVLEAELPAETVLEAMRLISEQLDLAVRVTIIEYYRVSGN